MSDILKDAYVHLSREDGEIIVSALRTAKVTGTLETLPELLSKIHLLAKKVSDAFVVVPPPPQEVAVEAPTEEEELKDIPFDDES